MKLSKEKFLEIVKENLPFIGGFYVGNVLQTSYKAGEFMTSQLIDPKNIGITLTFSAFLLLGRVALHSLKKEENIASTTKYKLK